MTEVTTMDPMRKAASISVLSIDNAYRKHDYLAHTNCLLKCTKYTLQKEHHWSKG